MNESTPFRLPRFFLPVRELMEDPNGLLQPFPWLAQMREHSPIRFDPHREAWDVFRYEDIQRVLTDTDSFSSNMGTTIEGQLESIISMDPPRHTRFRTLVNKAFTIKQVQDLAPQIAAMTDQLLEKALARGDGKLDLTADFSSPLPVTVIATLLGVPPEDREFFKKTSDVAVLGIAEEGQTIEDLQKLKQESQAALAGYFTKILAERREQPREDLISALLAAEVDGQPLTVQELLGFCFILLIAGNETTTNLINNAVAELIEQPELQATLQAQPELIPAFIEEVLRFRPPVKTIIRNARADMEFQGHQLKAGQTLTLWLASGNRDASRFEDPETFRLDRAANPHMTFGYGIHFCLGAPLARLEAKIALEGLLRTLPRLALQEGAVYEPLTSPFVHGVKTVPLSV